mgnify:FL=1
MFSYWYPNLWRHLWEQKKQTEIVDMRCTLSLLSLAEAMPNTHKHIHSHIRKPILHMQEITSA